MKVDHSCLRATALSLSGEVHMSISDVEPHFGQRSHLAGRSGGTAQALEVPCQRLRKRQSEEPRSRDLFASSSLARFGRAVDSTSKAAAGSEAKSFLLERSREGRSTLPPVDAATPQLCCLGAIRRGAQVQQILEDED
jgi:hypothetical protein